jgi:hypothetical protein
MRHDGACRSGRKARRKHRRLVAQIEELHEQVGRRRIGPLEVVEDEDGLALGYPARDLAHERMDLLAQLRPFGGSGGAGRCDVEEDVERAPRFLIGALLGRQ